MNDFTTFNLWSDRYLHFILFTVKGSLKRTEKRLRLGCIWSYNNVFKEELWMLSPSWKWANYKIVTCNSVPWPGSQENIWVILDRDHRSDTLFLVRFVLSFLVYTMQNYVYLSHVYIPCDNANTLTFNCYVQLSLLYHSLIWVTVSSLNVCSLAVTLTLFDPAGVYCSIIISMVTGSNSINRRLSLLYDQEAAGEPWRLIFQQCWDPTTLINIFM